jgi:hypothetical protein
MSYDFPLPRPRGFQAEEDKRKCEENFPCGGEEFKVNGMILYALLARMTSNNETVHEFETLYDPKCKLLEVDIPSCYLDYIETIKVGPNIKRYLRWLVGIGVDSIAGSLVWRDMGELVRLSPTRFQTPDRFVESSLAVFISGLKVERLNADGFVIIDDHTFELNSLCSPRHRVSVGYMKRDLTGSNDDTYPPCDKDLNIKSDP